MTTATAQPAYAAQSWENPIFLKELRCSSRRVRFYAVRSVYVLALGFFAVLAWLAQAPSSVRPLEGDLTDLGRSLAGTIAWFQFILCQLAAVIVMSTAINGEIRKRTLSALLTCPVGNFQIAWGKMFAGLQYVLLLIACSLPLLALLRVLGGVPFRFVAHSLLLTVGVSVLAAAIGFHMSIIFRRPGDAIAMSIALLLVFHTVGGFLWPVLAAFLLLVAAKGLLRRLPHVVLKAVLLLPVLAAVGCYAAWIRYGWPVLEVFSPAVNMIGLSYWLGSPVQGPPTLLGAVWPMVLGIGWLYFASLLLKSVAYLRVWDTSQSLRGKEPRGAPSAAPSDPWALSESSRIVDASRPLKGNVRMPLGPRGPHFETDLPLVEPTGPHFEPLVAPPTLPLVPPPLPVVASGWTLDAAMEQWNSPIIWKDLRRRRWLASNPVAKILLRTLLFTVLTLVAGYTVFLIGLILLAIRSGMSIASEREARTWPILQTTGLSSWAIFWAKLLTVLLPMLPLWLGVAAGSAMILALMAPMTLPLILPLPGLLLLVLSSGIFLGTCIRQPGLCAVVNVAVAIVSVVLPTTLLGFFAIDAFIHTSTFDLFLATLMAAGMLLLVYAGLGVVVAQAAVRRFRRCAFE